MICMAISVKIKNKMKLGILVLNFLILKISNINQRIKHRIDKKAINE